MGHTLKVVGEDLQSQGRAYIDPTLALVDGLADGVAAVHPRGRGRRAQGRK